MKEFVRIKIDGKLIKIDKECEEIILYFNSIGLKTKYSCSGHNIETFYVMFDDNITDDIIYQYLRQYSNKWGHCLF